MKNSSRVQHSFDRSAYVTFTQWLINLAFDQTFKKVGTINNKQSNESLYFIFGVETSIAHSASNYHPLSDTETQSG